MVDLLLAGIFGVWDFTSQIVGCRVSRGVESF